MNDDEPVKKRRFSLFRSEVEADVNVHVFIVSAGLVGVCLTVIGIVRISVNLRAGYATIADDLLAVDSLFFMAACLMAYVSLRSPSRPRAQRFGGFADRVFITGLALMVGTCALIGFSLL